MAFLAKLPWVELPAMAILAVVIRHHAGIAVPGWNVTARGFLGVS